MTHDVAVAGTGNAAHCAALAAREGGASVLVLEKAPESQRDGTSPPKSNWAQKLDTPPYVGFSVTCGISFTFGGLRVDLGGQVQDIEDRQIRGLYAAGELVGGLFYHNHPCGAGLMAGSVFGKGAGESAAADIGAKAT